MNKGKGQQKWAASLAALLLVMNANLPFAHAEESAQSSDEEKEVIVVYKNNEGKQAVLDKSEEIDHQFKTVPAVSATLGEKEIEQLEQNPNISHIEDNVIFRLSDSKMQILNDIPTVQTTEDDIAISPEESQWNLQAVKAPVAWKEDLTGKGVKMAVVDTGISAHPDLTITGGVSTVDYTTSYEDDNGHGTHVAGTIGAKRDGSGMVGVAPDVSLYAVKAMDNKGEGTLQDILEAIDWSIVNNMDIINLSLGTDTDSDVFHSIVDKANERGIIIIGASGNSGSIVEYPAKYSSVIAVSAVDSSKHLASFSSRGEEVEFAAPGVDIISTYPGEKYAVGSGTSMASPHVAGLFALLKQKYPDQTNEQLRAEMQKYTEDLGDPGRDPWYGYGFTYYQQLPAEQKAEQPKETNQAQTLPTDSTTDPSSSTLPNSSESTTDPTLSAPANSPASAPAQPTNSTPGEGVPSNPIPVTPVDFPAPTLKEPAESTQREQSDSSRAAPGSEMQPISPAFGGGGSAPMVQPTSPVSGGGGGGGGSAPSIDKNTVKNSTGGTVSTNDAAVTFPANAAGSDIKITVNKITNTTDFPIAENSKLIGDIFEIKKDKPGDFVKPVTVTLPFEKSKVDMDKYIVSLFWLNEETKKWVELDNIKVETSTISGTVTHFTKFALIATKKIEDVPKQPEAFITPKETFSDITGHWAEASFTKLLNMGVLHGFNDGTIRPNKSITRAEFAAMIVNAFHLQPKGEKAFKDVPSSYWAKNEISIAASTGIINGYSPATFGPNDLLTREQMAAMIVKAAKLPVIDKGKVFKDQASISVWAAQAVSTASANGVINGRPGGLFNPKGKATRAEAITVIVNALNKQ